jgi:hypothetical protein
MRLFPMRIPMGFAVCYNKFLDVVPIPSLSDDGYIENWEYFEDSMTR